MFETIDRAASLSAAQVRHLLRVTGATSRHPERDTLILLLGHSCGLRVSETARLTVADVMFSSGRWRQEVSVRGAIAKNGTQRCVYLTSNRLLAALSDYTAMRQRLQIGTTYEAEYRGLRPHQPLILSRRGYGYSMNTKRRTLADGERRDYFAADSLQRHITELYRRAGFPGASSHSGRRSLATAVLAKTGCMDTVAQLLGHECGIDVTARYVDVDERVLRQAFADVL